MRGILDFTTVRAALSTPGVVAFRTDWTGQTIRRDHEGSPTDFIAIAVDGSEQPWSKPSEDLLATDWIIRSPPEGSA